jgi:flagellar M-ring protein FliF
VIENVSFSSNVPEVKVAGLERVMDETGQVLQTQPGLLKMLSVVGICVLLVMAVVRPMARQMGLALSGASPVLAVAGGPGTAAAVGVAAGAAKAGSVTAVVEPVRPPPPAFDPIRGSKQAQMVYEHVSEQIRRDPVQSTRLVKSWIGQPGEERD